MVTVYCIETAKAKNFQDESLDLVLVDSFWPTAHEAYDRLRELKSCRKEKRNGITIFRNHFALEDLPTAKEKVA